MLTPEVTKPNEEEGETFAYEMILLLKLMDLKRLFLRDLGMKLLLLNEDSVAVKTDEFLI